MKKSKFPYLLGFSAFATAAIAAYFSVTGLGKLFAGSAISIMVMAGVLEFSKLVVASYVYRYWKKIKALEKTYLISALFVLIKSSKVIYFTQNVNISGIVVLSELPLSISKLTA